MSDRYRFILAESGPLKQILVELTADRRMLQKTYGDLDKSVEVKRHVID